jgi:hypothetical protein
MDCDMREFSNQVETPQRSAWGGRFGRRWRLTPALARACSFPGFLGRDRLVRADLAVRSVDHDGSAAGLLGELAGELDRSLLRFGMAGRGVAS